MKRFFCFLIFINIILAIDFQKDKYKLSLNSLFTFNFDYAQRKKDTAVLTTNSFYFSKVYLDIVNGYQDFFLFKFSLDISDLEGKPSYELYGEIKPKSTLKIILGKFKQPLGYEISLLPYEGYLFEPSFIYWRRASSIYDLGVSLFYFFKDFDININLINGSGRLANWDNNSWKDVSGRLVWRPVKDLFLGTNFYYGKVGTDKNRDLLPFLRIGGEWGYIKSSTIFIFEFLFGRDKDIAYRVYQKQGFYLLFGYQIDKILPALRFDFIREKKETKEITKEMGLTFALNYYLKEKDFKISPNFCFHHYGKTHYLVKFVFQFQGCI